LPTRKPTSSPTTKPTTPVVPTVCSISVSQSDIHIASISVATFLRRKSKYVLPL
jgi:hypothetical protein